MKNRLTITTPSDREIEMVRIFDAPRDLVFDCWTKPDLLRRWLTGPPGWEFVVCDVDLRVGGKYRYVWRNADGVEMGMGGVHREVVRPERIVNTQLFDQDWTGGEAIGTLVLTERDGKTISTNTVLYTSKEARDGCLKTGMEEGMAAGYDRLDTILSATRTRSWGEFCWINMLTPEPTAAMAFFGRLLGWSFFEMPGVGHGIRVGGHDVGGLFDLHGPNTPPGMPPTIGVMVKVASADATAERVVALGGKAMPAFDVFDAGRMAVCHDPSGAQFDLWQPKKMPGTDVDPSLPGAPCWFETLTSDVARATQFYTDLFGWTAESMPMGNWTYTTLKLGANPVAGMMPILPEMGAIPSHWAIYVTSTDVDATARLVVELGGSVCVPPREIPGVGRFAGIISPQGVRFYAFQMNR